MIRAPKTTPMIRATCCFHGVAPTSWPVLRSWRLSFEIVAIQNTIADVNSVYAISAVFSSVVEPRPCTARMATAVMTTTSRPTPDTGEFDEPIRPAM